jgi:hypothetical protein
MEKGLPMRRFEESFCSLFFRFSFVTSRLLLIDYSHYLVTLVDMTYMLALLWQPACRSSFVSELNLAIHCDINFNLCCFSLPFLLPLSNLCQSQAKVDRHS